MNDLVEETLRHRAERTRLTPPELGDVLDRVDSVRRRRRATLVSAASLVVVVLIVGLAQVVTRGPGSAHRPVADPSLTGTGSAHASPPGPVTSLAGVDRGAAPGIAYGYGLRLHLADGRVVDAPRGHDYNGWTPYAGGLLMADIVAGALVHYDDDGRLVATYAPEVSPAISSDGRRTAWVDDDTVVVGATSGSRPLPRDVPGAESVAGFLPGDALAVNAARPLVVRSHSSRALVGLRTVVASNQRTGLASGTYDARGDYAVVDTASGRTLWRTPMLLSRFSPDGRYVTALPNRARPHRVVVLDARTGRSVTSASFTRARVRATAWEDDTRLLLVAEDGTEQALIRLGADGSLDRATPVTSSEAATYVFARRP